MDIDPIKSADKIKEWNFLTRQIFFSFLFIAPLWFIGLFLFKRDIFSNPYLIYIPIVFSFCLTTSYYLFIAFFEIIILKRHWTNSDVIFTESGIFGTIILSVCIFGCYCLKTNKWYPQPVSFLCLLTVVLVATVVWCFGAHLFQRQQRKKGKTETIG